jgi:hypothetical protein
MSEGLKGLPADGQPPPNYPTGPGTAGLDRAYLRPIRQPLFDAEWLLPGKPCDGISMFKAHLDDRFYYRADDHKTRNHTNMNLPGAICYPLQFSVLGFNYAVNEDVSPEDRAKITSGLFSFSCDRRTYLDMPLIGMPSERRRKPVSEIISRIRRRQEGLEAKTIEISSEQYKVDIAQLHKEINDEALYDFTIDRATLKLKHDDSFGVQFSWDKPIEVSKPVLLYTSIVGLM